MSKPDKLSEIQILANGRNLGGYFRCSICNCVSNEAIETTMGDFKAHMRFTHDPKDSRHFICVDCSESISENISELEEREEWKKENNT